MFSYSGPTITPTTAKRAMAAIPTSFAVGAGVEKRPAKINGKYLRTGEEILQAKMFLIMLKKWKNLVRAKYF